MSIPRTQIKRETDLQIISGWIEPGSRVLDLGCGRGILLEHLARTKNIQGIGVDVDNRKILGCVKRGVPAYQGDAEKVLAEFPDRFFDWIVCSRTVQELARPRHVILEALRAGRRLAVGFVNFGYWLNRASLAWRGSRVRNDVYPDSWDQSPPVNPVAIRDFEKFCGRQNIRVERRIYLAGDWETPLRLLPNLRSGYALYSLSRPVSQPS